MATGQKHLVKCRCVLPQFKGRPDPPAHRFVVFSIIEDDDRVRVKFAQCNNCGIVHKVTDLCRSEIVQGREAMPSLVTIDDIRTSLPEQLTALLDANHADLPTWEQTQYIYENQRWGDIVVLQTDVEGDLKQGKYVRILGERLFKVDTFAREEYVK